MSGKSTKILGINAYHGDASAALVVNGQLIAAVEEERFNRVKHWAGFPAEAIRWCLDHAGLNPRDLDHVAISFDPRANFGKRLKFVATQRPSFGAIADRLHRQTKTFALEQQFAEAVGYPEKHITAQFHRVEHHQTHVASGFLLSPFEEAAILSIDGMGDFCSTLTAHARGNNWKILDRVWFPHSLGFLYTAVTLFLGFPAYGDEYKVMGLASYGKPEFVEVFRKIIHPRGETFKLNLDYFTHHERGVRMTWNEGAPVVEPFHSRKLEESLGAMRRQEEKLDSRHENIASSLQVVTEEVICHLLWRLAERTKSKNLCLVGGCAMNSVVNGKITRKTPFESVFVPPAAADNGTSIGAAFYVWNRVLDEPRTFVLPHAYWGGAWSKEACRRAAEAAQVSFVCLDQARLLEQTTDLLLQGKVVGWFQGPMEFGARALGNRSLLADPRRADMREIINSRIKFREKFRPFAPSILQEFVSEWFEIEELSPFMERVLPIRQKKHAMIPAVTHVDGSGRLQTVSRQSNPLFHALISRFHEKTGVPILLNTSLNENEPIVRTPAEAISCFLRTEMDALALGNCFLVRESVPKK